MSLDKILLNLFFPPRCLFCGELKEDDGICSDCQKILPWMGERVRPAKAEFLEGCVAPLWYEGLVVPSFHRYKFSGRRRYCKTYSMLMAQSLEDSLENNLENNLEKRPDYITWAPISPTRYRRRGYDQSRLLAEGLSRRLDIPLLDCLEKWRDTPPQSSLETAAEKKANALGAYRMRKNLDLSGKRVLLVDDIFTTGSTLSECARVLVTAGAQSVTCVTLARADKNS